MNSFEVNGTTTTWVCIFSLCLSLSRRGFCHARPYQLQRRSLSPLALLPFLTRNSLIYSPTSDGVQDPAAGFVCTQQHFFQTCIYRRQGGMTKFLTRHCAKVLHPQRCEFEISQAQKFCFLINRYFCLHRLF